MKKKFKEIRKWGLPVDRFFLVAGPCSAESRKQVLETAEKLSGFGISFMRAGIWKPRTHPGNFEGVGIEGLKWLQEVKEKTGIRTGIEVASSEHVEACLKHGIDAVWIGARTTPNPFAVQEIADSLKGTDLPVLIKNPVSPDIGLWIGAVERIAGAGIKKIGVIHRGFSSDRKSDYRNAPLWRIPIELKRRIPTIPILCDPSHICGSRKLIPAIAQEALDLLYDGLMLEVHPNPKSALSDSQQQLTPDSFKKLLAKLEVKSELPENSDFLEKLRNLRQDVDHIDTEVIELIGKRMDVVKNMAELKKKNHVSVLQPKRWKKMLEDRIEEGNENGLSAEFMTQLFQAIHVEAIGKQEE